VENLIYPLLFFVLFAIVLWVLAGMPRPGVGRR
jgi:hypothetical protein